MARFERHATTDVVGHAFSEALTRADFSWRSERAIHHRPQSFPTGC
jgi:hypothetical protein